MYKNLKDGQNSVATSAETKNSAAKQTVVFFDENGVAAHSFQMPEEEAFELAKYAEENYKTDVHYEGHSKVHQLELDCSESKPSYSQINIKNCYDDFIYESYCKTEDALELANQALHQFKLLGYKIDELETNYWKASHTDKDPYWIEVESQDWEGADEEFEGMRDCILNEFFDEDGLPRE